jgi:hypothetical protein
MADVVARELNLDELSLYECTFADRDGTDTGLPIVYDSQGGVCSGHEERFADCPRSEWNYHNCGHHEDIAVHCSIHE